LIRIPLTSKESQNFVELQSESLPQETEKLIKMLNFEKVPIQYWV
jgi:hypothetical protein